jgi:hypothetical protein
MTNAACHRSRPAPGPLGLLEGASLAFFLAAMAWLVMLWLRMMVSPAPQEMREGAIILTTLALLDGRNPYASEVAAVSGNLYGLLYPLLVVPFALILGPGLAVHRLVNALGLLIAAVLVWRAARRAGAERLPALLAALLTLTGWLYWVGPTVRPDGVGLACMLGALAVAAPDPGSPRRFATALVLSLAGFAAKIYFLGGVFIVAAHVFLFVGWRRGIVFGAVTLAATAAWAWLLALLLPAWGAHVLGANVGATSYDTAHLIRQGKDWLIFSLPLLAWLAAGAMLLPWARWRGEAGFWGFAALCGLAVLLASLGGHSGAHMTYFFHLLTPPLAIALAAATGSATGPRRAAVLALPVAVLLNAHWFVLSPSRFAEAEARFAIADAALAGARTSLVTTEFAGLAALAGHAPLETGHSEYMLDTAEAAALRARIAATLAAGGFEVVIVNRNNGGLVHARDVEAAGYRRVAELPVDLVWAAQAWGADIWLPPP